MITDIRLQNFRSYKDSSFELDRGVNIIVGPNASGKTSLLESIMTISRGASFRPAGGEQIRFGQDWARLEAHTTSGGTRTVKIKRSEGGKLIKQIEIDSKTYKHLRLSKAVPVVLFEPQHLLILTSRPDLRRDYMDDLLEQTTVGYGGLRADYRRALYQRNSLLKKGGQVAKQQLFAWNIRLSELGSQMAKYRSHLVDGINSELSKLYQQLSKSNAEAKATYVTSLDVSNYGSSFIKKLEAEIDADLGRGFTGYGPHRDDLLITLNNHDAQHTASRGEIRTLLLALKIIELNILEDLNGIRPILLLDDVFSELDGARRKALTSYLKDYQTFITTTDADLVVQNFAQKCHIISTQK